MVRLICMDLFNNLMFHYNMKQVISSTDILVFLKSRKFIIM